MNYLRIFLIAVILYFTSASYVASQEQQPNGIISAMRKSAEQGDRIPQYLLGMQYLKGEGVVQEWKPVVLFNPSELSEVASPKRSIQVAQNKKIPRRYILVPQNNNMGNMKPDDEIIVSTNNKDATLRGIVKDNDGKPLSHAQVAYENLEREMNGGQLTPSSGEYKFTQYPGSFTVEVTKPGFKPWSRSGIILESGETQYLDIKLVPKRKPTTITTLQPEEYAQQAVEAVKKKWESQYTDRFQYEVIGKPVIRPVHDADISGIESKGRILFGLAPRALVLVKMRKGEQIYYTALVSFLDQIEKPQVIIHTQYPFGSTNSYYPMEEEEWSQVVKDLEPFYTAAMDISRGPERFEPFIQYMLNNKVLPEGGSSDLLAPVACLPLHEMTLKNWLQFEGLAPNKTDVFAVWSAWVDLERVNDPDDLPKASRNLLKKLDKWKDILRKAGSLEPDQLQSVSAYIRQMFGEGLIVKHPIGLIQGARLSRSAMVYSALFCQLRCNVQFAYIDGNLRIVGISVPRTYGRFRGLY